MALPDPMLLTLPSPAKRGFDFKSPHDFAGSHTISSTPQQLSSPPPERSVISYYPRKSPAEGRGVNNSNPQMSSNPPHSRNLPPPPPLSLPDPRGLQPPPPPSAPQALPSSLGPLPAPPSQWQGNEDQMKTWLQTKGEEERRKQEEEKSKQEHYRLEQRRIEQNMLQDSLRAGVSGVWLPMLFFAMSHSASLAGSEVFQNYLSQMLAHQAPQHSGTSPESARSGIHPSQSHSYGAQPAPQTPVGQSSYPQFPGPTSTASMRSGPTAPSASGRGPSFDTLPRLATQHAAMASGQAGSGPTSQAQETASPIYFHHWTPPTSQSGAAGPGGGSSNPAPATSTGMPT